MLAFLEVLAVASAVSLCIACYGVLAFARAFSRSSER